VSATSRTARRRDIVPAAPRLEARARAQRSVRRRQALHRVRLALVILLPLVAVGWMVLFSTWLSLDRVEVTGVSRLQASSVRTAAEVALGTPLARVDTGAVERRVAALPPVERVAVRRTWPGTLTVAVTERTAAAAVVEDGSVTLVDASGVPFATEPQLPPGLVRLEVDAPGPQDDATRAALDVHRTLPEALRSRVAAVRAPSAAGVVLVLADGRQVVWGRPGGTATKAAAALALLSRPGTVLDVSAEGVVVVK
jgi:cell division protein FtsQ